MSVGRSLGKGIFVVAGKRTPFGTFGGSLKSFSPVELQVEACKAALNSGGLSAEIVDSVCVGNVLSASSVDASYIARHVALQSGCRTEIPALTVNRLCGSGFQSILNGIQEISIGDAGVVMTGGSDNMSASPYAVRDVRFGTKLGKNPVMEDMLWASLTDMNIKTPMGVTAENLAEKYSITREEADEFAVRSQMKWAEAKKAGLLDREMAPIQIKTRKGVKVLDTDEHPKPESTVESLSKLPSVFKKGGVVTAGSASGICDGAGCVIIASEEAVAKNDLKPLARILGYGLSGCDPHIMGFGPVPSIRAMLKQTGMNLDQIDELEINEAFGAQALACLKELGYPMEKFNTAGGAIALGHPLAASGSRITAHLVHKLRAKNLKYGIGSACIGGGQGIALLFEKM